MMQVNMLEAKTDLSKLVRLLETQEQDIIYIARNGQEVAQLTLIPKKPAANRIGAANTGVPLPDDFDAQFDNADKDILEMFAEDRDL